MTASIFKHPAWAKTAGAMAISLLCLSSAQAAVVNGTIYKNTAAAATGAGTTVDYYRFTLASAANVIIDVRANEGYVNAWGSHPGAYVDLNGDGEITLSDTHFRLFQSSLALENEVIAADDSKGWTAPGNTDGWADGSLSSRDSYLSTALDVGTYILAFGDYQLTTQEAVDGFNATDALTAATGVNPFTGATGQDHFDYQITFGFKDFDTNQAMNVGVSAGAEGPAAVPVPGGVWLFGSAMAGFGVIRKRKQA